MGDICCPKEINTEKEKSRTMKFINLSPPEDFYLKLQTSVDILMKNVLYITHELDHVKKIVNEMKNSLDLQKQVDEFFEEDRKDTPEKEN